MEYPWSGKIRFEYDGGDRFDMYMNDFYLTTIRLFNTVGKKKSLLPEARRFQNIFDVDFEGVDEIIETEWDGIVFINQLKEGAPIFELKFDDEPITKFVPSSPVGNALEDEFSLNFYDLVDEQYKLYELSEKRKASKGKRKDRSAYHKARKLEKEAQESQEVASLKTKIKAQLEKHGVRPVKGELYSRKQIAEVVAKLEGN